MNPDKDSLDYMTRLRKAVKLAQENIKRWEEIKLSIENLKKRMLKDLKDNEKQKDSDI